MSISVPVLGGRFGARDGAAALLVLAGLVVPLLPHRRWSASPPGR